MRKKVDVHADNNISVDHDQQQHDKISSTRKLDYKDSASGPSSSMLATSSTTSTALAARRSSTTTSSAVLESRRNSSPPTSKKIPPVQLLPGEPPPPDSVAPEPPDGKFYYPRSQHDGHRPSQQEVVEHQHDLQPPGSTTTEFISRTSAHLSHDRQRPARGTTSSIGQELQQQGDAISTMQRFVMPGPSEGEGPPDGTSSSASAALELKRTTTTRRSVLRPEIKVELQGGQALRPPAALVPPKRPPERKPHGTTRAIAKQLHQGHEDVDEQAPLLVPGDQPEDASRAALPFMSEAVDEGVSVDLVQRQGEGEDVAGTLASRRPAGTTSVVEKHQAESRHKNYRFLDHRPQGQDLQEDSGFELGTSRNGVMLMKIPKNNTSAASTNRTAGKIAELQSFSVVERHDQHLGGRRAASNHEVASLLSVEDGGSIDFQQLFKDTLPRHMTWEHLFNQNPAAKTVQGQPTGLLTRYFQERHVGNELDVSDEAVEAIIQQYGQTLCSTLSFNIMLAADSSLHTSPPHGDGGKAYNCNQGDLRSVFYPNGVGREWSKMYGAPDDVIGYDHGGILPDRWKQLVDNGVAMHAWFPDHDEICDRDCSLLPAAKTAIAEAPRVITEAALVNIVLRCVQMDFGRTMWANGKDVANDGTNGAIMYATAAKPDPSYGEDQMFHYPWLEPMGDQGNPEYDYALVYNITQTSCKTLPGWLSHEELAARIQGYLAGVCMTSSVNDCTSAGVRPRVFPRDVAKEAQFPGGDKWFTSGTVCKTASNNAAAYDTMKQAMRLDLQSPDVAGDTLFYYTKPAYPGLLAGEDPEATSWRSTCIPSTADDKELAEENLAGLIELHTIYNRLQEYCKLVMLYDGTADGGLYQAQLFVVYGSANPPDSWGENSAPHNAEEHEYLEHRKNGCRALLYMDRAEPVRHTDGSVRTSPEVSTGVMDSWQQPKGYVIPGDNPEGHGLWEGHFLYAGLDYAEEFTELSLGGPGGGDGSSGDGTSTGANSTDAGDAGSTTPAPAPSSSTDAAGGEGDAGPTTPTPAAQGETGGDGSTGDSGGSAEGDEGNKTISHRKVKPI